MSSERKKFILESVLPNVAKAGRFGKGLQFLRCETNNDGELGDQFASSVVFINAVLRDSDGDTSVSKLVLKFLPDNARIREIMNSDNQFSNEIVMYSEILPSLDRNNIVQSLFPKFYFGNTSKEGGNEPIVVIEDLRSKNFGLAKHRVSLDYNHIVLVLRALGEFHGLSYIMKQQKPVEFNALKDKLLETVWNAPTTQFSASMIIGPSALRGAKALQNIQNNETLEKLVKKLESDSLELMRHFIEPEEPTAVICHGDFCNHNMLFSYEDSSDCPTSVRFIDLQTSRYASPVIDLSMILFLNTDPELRSCHWDEFITTYHNSVKNTVTSAGCVPPSFDQLIHDLQNKSFYGYFHCSYFLPLLLSEIRPDIDQAVNLEPGAVVKTFLEFGGERGTQSLVSILKHLQEHNYFAFLN